MSEYKLISVDINEEKKWDNFVDESPQGTIFHKLLYLQSIDQQHMVFWVKKGSEIKAGVSIIVDNSFQHSIANDLVIHSGIIFADSEGRNKAKILSEEFEITQFVIDRCVDKFKSIHFALSVQFNDIRPFQWHNYHSKNVSDKFKINIKYTSFLRIDGINKGKFEDTLFYKNLNSLRKRNYQEANKSNTSVLISEDIEILLDWYKYLMGSQNLKVSIKKSDQIRKMGHKLISSNNAKLYLSKDSEGECIYMALFGLDNKRAYYLFGAPNPSSNHRFKGTFTFIEAFKDLEKNHNIKIIDFEGVNSPTRGKFKQSFGGSISPYFEVTLSERLH